MCPNPSVTKTNKRKSSTGSPAKTNAPPPSGRRGNKQTSNNQKTTLPFATGGNQRNKGPLQVTSRNGKSTRITHREYFGSLTGKGDVLNGLELMVSPTNTLLFPWLEGISGNYESFLFHKLHIEYVPNCSAAEAGSIIIAIDYDPTDDNEITAQTLFAMKNSVFGNVWGSFTHRSDISDMRKQKTYYTTKDLAIPNPRQNAIGRLYCYADNVTNNHSAGRLFVNYDIEFFTQQPRDVNADTLFFKTANQDRNIVDPTNTVTWGYLSYARVGHNEIQVDNFEGMIMFHFQGPAGHNDSPHGYLEFTNFRAVYLAADVVWHSMASGADVNHHCIFYLVKTGRNKDERCSIKGILSSESPNRAVDPRLQFLPCGIAEMVNFLPISNVSGWIVQPPEGTLPVRQTHNISSIFA